MHRASFTEHVTNIEVLIGNGRKKQLFNKLQKHKLKFVGHIIRQEGMQREILEGMGEGKRSRGRGKTKNHIVGEYEV